MIKKMQINIDINTECDTPKKVKKLINELLKTTTDMCLGIESITIDGEENFKIGVGFMGDMSRNFI